MHNLSVTTYREAAFTPAAATAAKELARAIVDEPSLWEGIRLSHPRRLELALPDGRVYGLGSIDDDRLRAGTPRLGFIGRMILRMSLGARILGGLKGKEEVTFYCLINQPNGSHWLARTVDRVVLNMVAPPLAWRRKIVVREIRRGLHRALALGAKKVAFLDIGCGGGFDGLDLERLLKSVRNRLSPNEPPFECRVINVDIDELWLGNNASLANMLGCTSTSRHRLSAFDFLADGHNEEALADIEYLIVSCNGFADFLDNAQLGQLLRGICACADRASLGASAIVPVALENPVQELASRIVGFGYDGKNRAVVTSIIRESFPGYDVTTEEAYSQCAFMLARHPGQAGAQPTNAQAQE